MDPIRIDGSSTARQQLLAISRGESEFVSDRGDDLARSMFLSVPQDLEDGQQKGLVVRDRHLGAAV
jgi:hypothetical protein